MRCVCPDGDSMTRPYPARATQVIESGTRAISASMSPLGAAAGSHLTSEVHRCAAALAAAGVYLGGTTLGADPRVLRTAPMVLCPIQVRTLRSVPDCADGRVPQPRSASPSRIDARLVADRSA